MNTLFTPEPRQPVTYAEACLNSALGIFHPHITWERVRERGASDQYLHWLIAEYVFGLEKSHWSGPDDDWVRYTCVGGENPRFWAVTEEETRASLSNYRNRQPDYQGRTLLTVVRELRGVWRAA